jgi:hypothetical protein
VDQVFKKESYSIPLPIKSIPVVIKTDRTLHLCIDCVSIKIVEVKNNENIMYQIIQLHKT